MTQNIDWCLHQFVEWSTSLRVEARQCGDVLMCSFARCYFLPKRCLYIPVATVEQPYMNNEERKALVFSGFVMSHQKTADALWVWKQEVNQGSEIVTLPDSPTWTKIKRLSHLCWTFLGLWYAGKNKTHWIELYWGSMYCRCQGSSSLASYSLCSDRFIWLLIFFFILPFTFF